MTHRNKKELQGHTMTHSHIDVVNNLQMFTEVCSPLPASSGLILELLVLTEKFT